MDSQTRPDPALASLVPGMRVAGYRLEEGIGQGGMAVVFRAHEERLNRVVALKLLAPRLTQDKSAQERFLHEAYAAAAVDHPHIVPVHDAGDSGGLLYIATRFVPGGDLLAALAQSFLHDIVTPSGVSLQLPETPDDNAFFVSVVTGYWNMFKQNIGIMIAVAQLAATQPRFAAVQNEFRRFGMDTVAA